MNRKDTKVLLLPCSGIGKVHGLIGREAVYQAVAQLGPVADTLCLALVVSGDEDAVDAIRRHDCITIDGCPKLCSRKNLELAGGRISQSIRVVDVFKEHKGVRPGTATELTDGGRQIAATLAQRLVDKVESLLATEKGAQK